MSKIDKVEIHSRCQELHLLLDTNQLPHLQELNITAMGHGLERIHYEIHRQSRNGHQLIYTLGGNGWFKKDNKKIEVSAGTLWITEDGHEQHYGLNGDYWEILWIVFAADSKWWKLGTGARETGCYAGIWGESISNAVQGLYRESQSKDFGTTDLRSAYAQCLIIYLERELHPLVQPTLKTIQRQKLNIMLSNIQKDLSRNWTVDLLADLSGLNVCSNHFSRIAKSILGQTPLQLVTELRMRKAAELLSCSDYKLEVLSQMLGYSSPFALSVAFKRFYKISPDAYRKQRCTRSDP